MRIKSLVLSLVLAIVVATSAFAAPERNPSRDRGPQEPALITRIIDAVKRRLVHIQDDVSIPPPLVVRN
jgi:hypothetical protein